MSGVAEDGRGPLDVPGEEDGGADAHHRHDEAGQRRLQTETLNHLRYGRREDEKGEVETARHYANRGCFHVY